VAQSTSLLEERVTSLADTLLDALARRDEQDRQRMESKETAIRNIVQVCSRADSSLFFLVFFPLLMFYSLPAVMVAHFQDVLLANGQVSRDDLAAEFERLLAASLADEREGSLGELAADLQRRESELKAEQHAFFTVRGLRLVVLFLVFKLYFLFGVFLFVVVSLLIL
jgi:hypothetical protein